MPCPNCTNGWTGHPFNKRLCMTCGGDYQRTEPMSDGRKLRPVVYISGPITKGNRNWNVYQGFEAQRELTDAGFAPINPIASATYPFAWEPGFPHGTWMEVDLAIVARADAVLRLPGDSKGADEECMFADLRGIPIYGSVADLIKGFRSRKAVAASSKRRRSLTQGGQQA